MHSPLQKPAGSGKHHHQAQQFEHCSFAYLPSTGVGQLCAGPVFTDPDFNQFVMPAKAGIQYDGTETANGSDPLNPQSLPQLSTNGDISLDGNVNAADILIAQRYVLGLLTTLTAEQVSRGDLYPPGGDGLINLSDMLLISKQALLVP